MVRRPLENKRPIGPFFGEQADSDTAHGSSREPLEPDQIQDSSDPDFSSVTFESLDDLPDSPMLIQYVERQANYLGKDISEIINSKPVKQYMVRLGVWEAAKMKANGN